MKKIKVHVHRSLVSSIKQFFFVRVEINLDHITLGEVGETTKEKQCMDPLYWN